MKKGSGRIKIWLFHNLWIKIISLGLAIVTWFYVNNELAKQSGINDRPYKSSGMDQSLKKASFESKR